MCAHRRAAFAVALFASLVYYSLSFALESPPTRSERSPATAAAYSAREDTLFLFAASGPGSYDSPGTDARGFTFDTAAGGAPAGWYGVDLTAQTGTWWHVAGTAICAGTGTDMSQAAPFDAGDTANDYALWCGRQDVCGWSDPTGYGNWWQQTVVVDLSDQEIDQELRVACSYRSDFEGNDCDGFELRVEVSGEWETVYANYLTGDRTYRELSFTIPVAELNGAGTGTRVGFHFVSDSGWSDEDGSYLSDVGALWLDNLQLEVDGQPAFSADFEDGLEPARLSFATPAGAGLHAGLYSGLFYEDICITNDSAAWAFFDLDTYNPEYPIPVVAYGPPYVDEDLESPLLELDQHGQPIQLGPEDQLWVERQTYYDLPLEPLIFTRNPAVAARTVGDDCLRGFKRRNLVQYGPDPEWRTERFDITSDLMASAGGAAINGVKIRIGGVLDMCPYWCNLDGDGWEHTPAPFFDNIRVYVVAAPVAAWDAAAELRLQDNFAGPSGTVRIDPALDVQPPAGQTLVVGDSTALGVSMAAGGGLATSFNAEAGEQRPELRLCWRVAAGPHAGQITAAQADPDADDGIWSPWAGTMDLNGELWSSMQADSARVGGAVEPGSFAFDFNDAYFEPGDVIEYFYRAQSQQGATAAYPPTALAGDPAEREFWRVRCLPTAGMRILVVEDSSDAADAWRLGLEYTDCPAYDIFTTQAPASGLNNGLGCRATAADLAGYSVLFWDSGSLSRFTLTGPGTSQLCTDTALLLAWLANAEESSFAWILGNSIASEMSEQGSATLAQLLGAERILDDYNYLDLTGDMTPRVHGVHPIFEVNGLDSYFDVDGACPDLQYFDLIAPAGELAETAYRWGYDGGSDAVAGVLNFDPDGDGTYQNAQGTQAWVLYSPFSYGLFRDAGFDPGGYGLNYPLELPYILACSFGTPPHFWCETAADEAPPTVTALRGAHPNPFNPKTAIHFSLAAPGRACLRVYDLAGRRVATLLDGPTAAGAQSIEWNGRDEAGRRLASGVYFLRFEAAGVRAEEKLVLLK